MDKTGIASISGALIFGVIIVAGAYFVRDENAATAQNSAAAVHVASGERYREYQPTKDTDGDGMSDWEEELAGTDPTTPNEAPQTYENTALVLDRIRASSSRGSTSDEPETFTERFSRAYLQQMVESKYGNGQSSSVDSEEVANRAVTSLEDAIQHTAYSPNDLTVIRDSDESDVRTYGNELGAILNTNLIPRGGHPYALITKALQDEDPELLKYLDVYIDAYGYLRDEMLTLSVPHTLVQEHLAILNVLSAIHDSFVMVRDNLFADPVLGVGHALSLVEHIDAYQPTVSEMRGAFEARDIYYTSGEPGTKIFDF